MTKRLFANINVKNIDVSLLREQRDDLIVAIEDVINLSQYGDSETMKFREKQIESLEGVVNMLDVMLDIAEGK